jgi:hypothetical protein
VFDRLIRELLCAIAEVAAIALNTRAMRRSLVVFIFLLLLIRPPESPKVPFLLRGIQNFW